MYINLKNITSFDVVKVLKNRSKTKSWLYRNFLDPAAYRVLPMFRAPLQKIVDFIMRMRHKEHTN